MRGSLTVEGIVAIFIALSLGLVLADSLPLMKMAAKRAEVNLQLRALCSEEGNRQLSQIVKLGKTTETREVDGKTFLVKSEVSLSPIAGFWTLRVEVVNSKRETQSYSLAWTIAECKS